MYQVLSGGQLVVANTLYMKFTQKTWSIAISRDMVPQARLVVYCILNDGEVLTDSLHFYVNGIRSDGVWMFFSRQKWFYYIFGYGIN